MACDFSVGAYSAWHDYELSASLAYALTDQITITPSVLFTDGITSAARRNMSALGTHGPQWQGGVSASCSFRGVPIIANRAAVLCTGGGGSLIFVTRSRWAGLSGRLSPSPLL